MGNLVFIHVTPLSYIYGQLFLYVSMLPCIPAGDARERGARILALEAERDGVEGQLRQAREQVCRERLH